ncbi:MULTISPECIES: hypothetical protein [Streptacidiphilus]|uniref:Arginine decarboxylase n=1 Tax=Streptacidiphilus cavernicola TaxID=3342716 RepID=A0ABV6UP47_9ACTN|nr:hypothetical protein [Streptacidiphilus jeojiense]
MRGLSEYQPCSTGGDVRTIGSAAVGAVSTDPLAGTLSSDKVSAVRAPDGQRLPPFFRALRDYSFRDADSWHTPAHSGGLGFSKSPVGTAFADFYGRNLLGTDVSVSLPEFGSLLEHTGLIGEAERRAAEVYGAELTYFVLNGTSTADRIVGHFALAPGQSALVDRNCHKAVLHALVLSGARPTYLIPTRNGFGLIGPVAPAELDHNPMPIGPHEAGPSLAVITNSTYDGLCYDAVRAAQLLSRSVPRVHFDEAWFGYARFHPLYARRYGMSVTPEAMPGPDRPTVFSTQSTHKMLTAFSQAAMLHVRAAARAPVDVELLAETYMMHASTSPFYPMIASLEVSTAMMDGAQGELLIDTAVRQAIAFRQAMAATARRFRSQQGGGQHRWFFGVWQPPQVTDPTTGRTIAFETAPVELLSGDHRCWELAPEADWHGFTGLEHGFCLLDPLKVTITCPGITVSGTMEPWGIPARILAAYLESRGIHMEKTSDYTTLALFSMGSSPTKSAQLHASLVDFKEHYDHDRSLQDVLPALVADHPGSYRGLTLRELCDEMHDHLCSSGHTRLLDLAYTDLPLADTTPQDAYYRAMRQGTQRKALKESAHRTAAAMIAVTPPGIPVLMPGENCGPADGPLLHYLTALQEYDRAFPGFPSEIHGVHRDSSGDYYLNVLPEPG